MIELPDDTEMAKIANAVWNACDVRVTHNQLDELLRIAYPLIAARVRAEAVADERQRALNEAADEVHREQQTTREHQSLGFDPAGRLVILENLLRARARAAGSVPVATPVSPEVNFGDEFMPPSARIGDQEARRLGLMATGPVATPPAKGTKSAAELVRHVADADPEAHGRALARGYGVGPVATPTEPSKPCNCADFPSLAGEHSPWCGNTTGPRFSITGALPPAEQPEER